MNGRTSFAYSIAALTACLVLTASTGCARSMLAAIFVDPDNPTEVDMLHLVESPPGHLSGSLVVSALNSDGSRKTDAVYDVSGSITGSNVSLQVDSGLATLAQLFGSPTNLIGTLSGGALTLSAGNKSLRFQEMSQKQYEAALANLDTVAKHIVMVNQAKKALQEALFDEQRLNTDLRAYIQWGQRKIEHVPTARLWYTQRIDHYTKCLQTIRPLAAAGVPSWRWQDCVLAIENDKYERDQMVEGIRNIQSQNRQSVDRLNAGIDATQERFPKAVDAMDSACPYTKDADACENNVRKLKAAIPNGVLDAKVVADFRSIVPRVNAAIATDAQTSEDGESRLSSLAEQVATLYQSAH